MPKAEITYKPVDVNDVYEILELEKQVRKLRA